MFALRISINGIEQTIMGSSYHARDDAFRRVNALWNHRHEMFSMLGNRSTQNWIDFQIIADDGSTWSHQKIMQEIALRPELREPEKIW